MPARKIDSTQSTVLSKYMFTSVKFRLCSVSYSFRGGLYRGATRVDGARNEKQVWRPHVRTWGLSEASVL